MRFGKIIAAALTASAILATGVVFAGCGGEKEFMADYDITGLEVVDFDADNKFAGEAEFVAKTAKDGDFSLNYRLYEPIHEEGEKLPLLLFLHGAGERGTDNYSQITYTGFGELLSNGSELLDALIIAPQCAPNNMWVNFDADVNALSATYSVDEMPISQSLTAAHKLIKYYYNLGMVDTDRIYVMGMSMGGYGTWDSIMRYPDLFAAAVPICGGVDPTKAESLKDMPIKTFHGTLDPIIPVNGTRTMVQAIKDAGGTKIEYTEYEQGYHDVWNQAMSSSGLAEWMMSQKLSDRI